ncbi:helix-hairpin-helix domain-containing protein [Paenibacillus agricola]|uniref:DNA-binding protein n=1 Tax=Paenibacillus agricola TaxID=2716264 RepID=A0ABX0J390_9BACL|nr:helix-hairpin-helix domain-containing protein [Paenibacillus agricola]NHN30458.1 DNA-binding protein [Paenibacillus agricola]
MAKSAEPKSTESKPGSNFPNGLGKPAQRALAGAGYSRVEELAKVSEAELLQLHGMGPKALRLIRSTLADKGLSFSDKA